MARRHKHVVDPKNWATVYHRKVSETAKSVTYEYWVLCTECGEKGWTKKKTGHARQSAAAVYGVR